MLSQSLLNHGLGAGDIVVPEAKTRLDRRGPCIARVESEGGVDILPGWSELNLALLDVSSHGHGFGIVGERPDREIAAAESFTQAPTVEKEGDHTQLRFQQAGIGLCRPHVEGNRPFDVAGRLSILSHGEIGGRVGRQDSECLLKLDPCFGGVAFDRILFGTGEERGDVFRIALASCKR